MIGNTLRGVARVLPSGRRSRLRSEAFVTAMVVVLSACLGLAGCDKPPTFNELINGKKKEEPVAAPKVVQAPPKMAPEYIPPKPPEKPKRAAQEVLAEFNSTPPERRTNEQLVEIASSPEAADQFTELNLNSSGVGDAGLAALAKFEKVEKLSINACAYGNAGLANVAKMKSLTTLSMNGGAVRDSNCDKGLASIKEMHQLTSLSLEGANVTMAGITNIGEMVWLESLSLSGTRFTDDNLEQLKALVNLRELNISYTTVGDSGFEHLLPFHQLETLKIAHLPIRGTGLKELGKRNAFPNLQHLVMFENPSLDLTGYEGIFSFRKTLVSLDLGAAALDDNRFTNAVAPLSKLEKLLIHDNPNLSDGAMVKLPRLSKLKTLYFWKNPGIGDGSLTYIAKLKSLENLTMDVTNVTERGARALKKRLKNCEITFNYKKIE